MLVFLWLISFVWYVSWELRSGRADASHISSTTLLLAFTTVSTPDLITLLALI